MTVKMMEKPVRTSSTLTSLSLGGQVLDLCIRRRLLHCRGSLDRGRLGVVSLARRDDLTVARLEAEAELPGAVLVTSNLPAMTCTFLVA